MHNNLIQSTKRDVYIMRCEIIYYVICDNIKMRHGGYTDEDAVTSELDVVFGFAWPK